MSNPIRTYFQLLWRVESPLLIGAMDDYHDRVTICYANETPFIPGATLAGALTRKMDEANASYLFRGNEWSSEGDNDSNSSNHSLQGVTKNDFFSSRVVVSDAITTKKPSYIVRDGIRLNKNKRIIPGAKYDIKALERNHVFSSYIEIKQQADGLKAAELVERLLKTVEIEGLRLGSKTTRGFGELKLIAISKNTFHKNEFNKFCAFNPYEFQNAYSEESLQGIIPFKLNQSTKIKMYLRQKSGLAVRKYGSGNKISYLKNDTVAVLPGTSIAGVLRHYCDSLDNGKEHRSRINELFGMADEHQITKSKIVVKDSYILGSREKVASRIKINRITGGAEKGALVFEKYPESGDFVISMEIPSSENWFIDYLKYFCLDINDGFVTFGGAAGVGRGLCEVQKLIIDGNEIEFSQLAMETK